MCASAGSPPKNGAASDWDCGSLKDSRHTAPAACTQAAVSWEIGCGRSMRSVSLHFFRSCSLRGLHLRLLAAAKAIPTQNSALREAPVPVPAQGLGPFLENRVCTAPCGAGAPVALCGEMVLDAGLGGTVRGAVYPTARAF